MASIRDVAEAAGVSPMTVSFVLNNKAGQVSEGTRLRVLQTVRELGYRPRASHPQPTLKMNTVGIVSGVPGHTLREAGYYHEIISAILRSVDELSLNATLFASSLFNSDPHVSIRTYCDGRCDGLLVVTPHIGNALVQALGERGVPCVVVGTADEKTPLSCVDIDNLAEAQRLTTWLIEQGHRRLAFVGGPDFVASAQQREKGFCIALKAHAVPVEDEFVLRKVIYPSEIAAGVTRWMTQPEKQRPTALFCWDDGAARTTFNTLTQLGLKVPGDVSVLGWNDDPASRELRSPLTTLRQPYDELARLAVQELLRQIRKPSMPRKRLLKGELILRHSVAPPKD